MFDLSWSEMAVIMLVALIVIGPKDLPKVARTVGKWTGKARAMARDFQRSLDEMAREAELDEIKKSIDKAGHMNLRGAIKSIVDPEDELERAFDMEDGKAKPAPRKPATGRKPATAAKPASTRAALTQAAEPAIQPPPAVSDEAAPVPAEVGPAEVGPTERAPAAAGSEQSPSTRG